MPKKQLPFVSRNVLLLSIVSFLNDIGGETIKKIIPLYLLNVLGVQGGIIGLIEGIAESLPQLAQPLSGYLSDKYRTRKPFVIIGQTLRSFVLLLMFSTTWVHIILIRFFDRMGKGIANAPRDALVTESSSSKTLGRSFGVTRAFDNAGAVAGFVLSGLILYFLFQHAQVMTKELFQLLVGIAFIPLIIAMIIVTVGIKDIRSLPVKRSFTFRSMGARFWKFLFVCVVFTLANSSDAFLIIKAQELGMSLSSLFFLLAFYSGISAIVGLLMSSLSDTFGRKGILMTGWFLYGLLYVGFSSVTSISSLIVLFAGYGCFLGFTEGVMKAWVADIAEKDQRATAFGIYNMAIGCTFLFASLITGVLWQHIGLSGALLFDAGIAFLAVVLLFFLKK